MSGWKRLSDNLSELASVPSRISKPVSNGINELIKKQFDTGIDPYGTSWAKLLPSTIRRKKGDARVLLNTDSMMSQTVAVPLPGSGIELRTVTYASFHQTGTKHMVRREVLPCREDLPITWQNIISTEFSKAFKKF